MDDLNLLLMIMYGTGFYLIVTDKVLIGAVVLGITAMVDPSLTHAETVRLYEKPAVGGLPNYEYIEVDTDVPHVADVHYRNDWVAGTPNVNPEQTWVEWEFEGHTFQVVITMWEGSVPEAFEVICPPGFYPVPEVVPAVAEGETVTIEIYRMGMM